VLDQLENKIREMGKQQGLSEQEIQSKLDNLKKAQDTPPEKDKKIPGGGV